MSYLCVMTFWFCLVEGNKLYKRHVYNSLVPVLENEISYNISSWVKQLHLQQCVIVEIGEKYCAIFAEYRTITSEMQVGVDEYFLGICDIETVRRWKLCSTELERERPDDCIFRERTEQTRHPARVHRRLCDVTNLSNFGEQCNCSNLFAGQKLHRIIGFPTCFQPPLPESICTPRNVCGTFSCKANTVNRIHTVKCYPNCTDYQPFCEKLGAETTKPVQVHSYWSDWSKPSCSDGSSDCQYGLTYSESICINQYTGLGAIDCLGPGTSCCPIETEDCSCRLYMEDGVLKLFRLYRIKQYNVSREKRHAGSSSYKDEALQRIKELLRSEGHRNVVKRKDTSKEEEYDDDDNTDDDGSDDIVLEEDTEDSERPQHTTEKKEKDELRHEEHTKSSKDIAIQEMKEDLNQTTDDSKGISFTLHSVFYKLLSILLIFIIV